MPAKSVIIGVVGIGAPRDAIVGEAVAFFAESDEPRAQPFADRNVDRAAQAPHVVVSDRDVGIAFEVLRGLLRSEEHTSELQSLMRNSYAVFCLKTKKTQPKQHG